MTYTINLSQLVWSLIIGFGVGLLFTVILSVSDATSTWITFLFGVNMLQLMSILSCAFFMNRNATHAVRAIHHDRKSGSNKDNNNLTGELTETFDIMANSAEIPADPSDSCTNYSEEKDRQSTGSISSNKAVDFLAHISHEIRTALNAIVSVVPMLQETHLTSNQAKLVDLISLSGNHLMSLVNDILEYAKLRSGKVEAEIVPFNVAKEIETAVQVCVASARNKRIDLNVFCSANIIRPFANDPLRLRQVVINLVNNAIKFTNTGGFVSVRCGNDIKNPNRICITIKDNGIGMDRATQNKLFQPYVQAKLDTQRKFGGTGLGLYLVKRMIELTKGQLHVESEVNKGTEFTLTMPNLGDEFESGQRPSNATQLPGSATVIMLCHEYQDDITPIPNMNPDTTEWVVMTSLEELKQTVVRPVTAIELNEIACDQIACVFTTFKCSSSFHVSKWLNSYKEMLMGPIFMVWTPQDEAIPEDDIDVCVGTGLKVLYPPIMKANVLQALLAAPDANPLSPLRPRVSNVSFADNIKINVLYAEDNFALRKLTERHWKKLGVECTAAQNGEEAFRKFMMPTNRYDLVVTDVEMPVVGGIELARKIREVEEGKDKKVPIIFLSGNSEADMQKMCIPPINHSVFLTKPISVQDLREQLEQLTPYSRQSSLASSTTGT